MIYSTLLSFRGYAILAAASYDDALSVARAQRPDLAIIDIHLNDPQDRDGSDLACALRDDPRTKGIPVIAHTAFGDVYQDSLARAGCASVIHKPSSPAVLLSAIENLIGPGTDSPDYEGQPRERPDGDPPAGGAVSAEAEEP